ncbi:MAG: hypothetical protein JWM81_1097 [Candidatus Saccharibacteria bacterium]|nr:hypothetical protein [Candidatus Saccharibacteria bacterium]
MHNYLIPVLAAFACALCNGVAAVLQKMSADKEKNGHSLDVRLLWRLLQDRPYIIGTTLDLLGWLLTLVAVQHLPLFLVEAIIASNIIVTALIERLYRRIVITSKSYVAIVSILVGLTLLAVASLPGKAEPVSTLLRWMVVLTPIPVALLGYVLARRRSYKTALGLAALGGLAYGTTSVMGRILTITHPFWHIIYNPLMVGIIVSGALGILLFSIALQRAQATTVNATMTSSQIVIPAIIGITFLGDTARSGLWYLVIIGTLLALGGVISLAKNPK